MNINKANNPWTLRNWEEMRKRSKKAQQGRIRRTKKKRWEEIKKDQPIKTQSQFDDVARWCKLDRKYGENLEDKEENTI